MFWTKMLVGIYILIPVFILTVFYLFSQSLRDYFPNVSRGMTYGVIAAAIIIFVVAMSTWERNNANLKSKQ